MTVTYSQIATTTLGSATASYTFTSIPSTYTDLFLVLSGSASAGSSVFIRVGNGSIDSGSNYSRTGMQGDGTSASSYRGSNETQMTFDWFSTVIGVSNIHFLNYSNTTTNKTILYRGGWANTSTHAGVGLWRSTSAINQIQVGSYSYNMNSGTTISLYGIKAE